MYVCICIYKRTHTGKLPSDKFQDSETRILLYVYMHMFVYLYIYTYACIPVAMITTLMFCSCFLRLGSI